MKQKKGKATDYVAKQYIGNLGRTANGIVSVNAYAVVDNITYPLLFKVFKPRSTLQEKDKYKTQPQLAVEILQELRDFGFNISLVLADRLYGESGDVVEALVALKLPFIVAIRSNHVVWLSPQERVRYNRWHTYEQKLSHHRSEIRKVREIIFGKRRELRYFEITKSERQQDASDTWLIVTNLPGNIPAVLARLYSLRNWIESGFKQVKNQLRWADFRLTDYHSIEPWWERVFSTYLLVSLHASQFKLSTVHSDDSINSAKKHSPTSTETTEEISQHIWWESGTNWKSALNNLRLIIQPYIFWCLIAPWCQLFQISGLKRGFSKLIEIMNDYRASPIDFALAS